MYRGRNWTMRQYSGFGDAAATNERFHFLLGAGQTGLSCAFDLPTQMGYDSDHPRAEGEVGKVGVAIDSLDDMRALLNGLPLDTVTNLLQPVIDLLASWPANATWGEWLDRFAVLAPTVLRQPDGVLRVIAELRPMSGIGPVALAEARDVDAVQIGALYR